MAAPSANSSARREADLAAGRALLRDGSRSFHIASLMLPRGTRDAATALYAFCRIADDTIDLQDDPHGGLAQLRSQLDRVYDGNPLPQPVERLLAQAVRQHGIPRGLLDALLEGFEWDLDGRRYETIEDLQAYGARVAGSVGAMMTVLMGVRDTDVLARACDLGVAMQLTNIARDVGQDASLGRVYLPIAWLREAGIDADAWLAKPTFNKALAGVIERLLCAADDLYARSVQGISRLPPPVRPGVHAARLLYAEIGNDLRRNGWNSVARRAHVKAPRKIKLVIAALASAMRVPPAQKHAPLAATQFLLEAVSNCNWVPEAVHVAVTTGARHPQQGRVEWLVELFDRLERLEQQDQRSTLQSAQS